MAARRRTASRQGDSSVRSRRPVITIDENHRYVRMTEELDWTELQELVQTIRMA